MIAPRHAGEITFYEELGLTRGASPDQIREAFRTLARLLHPDQQTDMSLKEAAEKQMRKLNRIYAVLSDPERRRRYDQTLDHHRVVPLIVNPFAKSDHRGVGRMAWLGAAVVGIGLLVWLASFNSVGSDAAEAAPASTPAGTILAANDRSGEIMRLQSELKSVTEQRNSAAAELQRLRGSASAPPETAAAPSEPPPDTAFAETTRGQPAPEVPQLDRAEPGVNRRLAGFWFYARPHQGQENKNKGLYLPEFIEATISEENGIIHGKYRSRFQIPDRAISPDVNFSFTGTPNGPAITCPWTGPGGARGELTLRLTADNLMRIDWTSFDLGAQQGLASGTAVLTRRVE